jgi:hypothetical protein
MGVALEFLGSARVRLSFSGPGRPGGDSLSPDRVPGSVPPPWWQPDSPRPDTSGVLTVEYEMLPSGVLVGPDPSGLFLSRYAFDILPGDTVAVGDTWTRSFDSGTILRLRSELLAVSAESLVTNLAGFRRYPPDSDGSPEWHRQLEGSAVFDLAERCTRRASFTAALPAADSGRARTVKVTIGRVEVR